MTTAQSNIRGKAQASSAGPATAELANLATLAAPLRGRCEPVRKSPFYLVALVFVAGLMVLLPLVYVALVVAVGAATVWHAVNDITIVQGARGVGSAKFAIIAYVGPLIAGAIGVIFMIKPLFAPRSERPEPCTLRPGEEPLLFGFVETLCSYMGAPSPKRIDVDCDVNASASFRRGFVSMVGNDLVLTVGLPLVAGLSLRELTGVLAHELGHFAQGSGMRLGYLIARINRWFARVAYERDAWDDTLDEWRHESGHWIGAIIVWMAVLCVFLSRLLLRVLMHAGLFFSSMLSRQQEYDADRWAARICGSECYAPTAERLLELDTARGPTFHEIGHRWRSRTLPDDLVTLLLSNTRALPADVMSRLKAHLRSQKAGVLDTHPSFSQRVRSVTKAAEPGVFRIDAPATVLFRDFSAVCRRASYLHYRAVVGEEIFEATLVPTQGVVEQVEVRREKTGALDAFLAGMVAPSHPPRVPADIEPPRDQRAALERLKGVRAELQVGMAGAKERIAKAVKAGERAGELRGASAVVEAGLVLVPVRFHLADKQKNDLATQLAAAEAAYAQAVAPLENTARLMGERLHVCLSLLSVSGATAKIPDAAALAARAARLVPAYRAAARAVEILHPWDDDVRVVTDLFKAVHREGDKERAIAAAGRVMERAHADLERVRDEVAGQIVVLGPDIVDLAETIIGTAVPPASNVRDLFEALKRASASSGALCGTMLAELCGAALLVENALKLPALVAQREG